MRPPASTAALQRSADATPVAPQPPIAALQVPREPAWTSADGVSIAGYALGLWWCLGGPSWAGAASIVLDEVDGAVARRTVSTRHGSNLDWGADVALTPLALMRLGQEIGHPVAAIVAAPPVLFAQATMRAEGIAPTIGSARAAAMLAGIIAHEVKSSRARRRDRT